MIIPDNVRYIMESFKKEGIVAYVVGGAVRDSLLGRMPHDYDLASPLPVQDAKLVLEIYGFRTSPVGMEFGTVVAMRAGEEYEVTTFRKDGEYADGRHPNGVTFAKTIEEDLSRRDFTINAMAADLDGNITDPFGGQEDIKEKIVRCVGDPNKRFEEDALRMMRAVRFSAQLGFGIERNTVEAIKNNAPLIKNVSFERIQDEMTKILCSGNPKIGVYLLYETGLFQILFPELTPMFGCSQKSRYHFEDVAMHSLSVVERSFTDKITRWAAFLHDCGKPIAKETKPDGSESFPGHAKISADLSEDILKKLKFSNKEIDEIIELVYFHDVSYPEMAKVREFTANHSDDFLDNLKNLQRADALSRLPECADELLSVSKSFFERVKTCREDGSAILLKDLAIDGRDLSKIGFKGKDIGDVLNEEYKLCLGNPSLNTRENLVKFATKRYFEILENKGLQKEDDELTPEL